LFIKELGFVELAKDHGELVPSLGPQVVGQLLERPDQVDQQRATYHE
jgi:hypothetical protein